jgi:hypothetical protein
MTSTSRKTVASRLPPHADHRLAPLQPLDNHLCHLRPLRLSVRPSSIFDLHHALQHPPSPRPCPLPRLRRCPSQRLARPGTSRTPTREPSLPTLHYHRHLHPYRHGRCLPTLRHGPALSDALDGASAAWRPAEDDELGSMGECGRVDGPWEGEQAVGRQAEG